jgi:hypothetical protein
MVVNAQPHPALAGKDTRAMRYYIPSGLPDFSSYKIPKWEKYTKFLPSIPIVHKI